MDHLTPEIREHLGKLMEKAADVAADSDAPTQEENDSKPTEDEKLLLALLLLLLASTGASMSSAIISATTHGISDGLGTAGAWNAYEDVLATVADAHAHAAYLGRQKAGILDPYGDADLDFGKVVASEQARYVAGFLDDIASGDPRYSTMDENGAVALNEAAIAQRANLHGLRAVGTANEAWARSLEPEMMVDWVLGAPESHHCATCPDLAANGPYKASQLPTYPRTGGTDCLTLCLCLLRASNGSTSFVL